MCHDHGGGSWRRLSRGLSARWCSLCLASPGKFVTEEVAWNQVSPEWSTRLPWAVAGRCVEKLQRVLERVAMKLDRDCSLKLICAITNPASLDEMAEQAVAVLNCVRPVLGGVGNTHIVPVFKQPRIYSAVKTWIHPKETHDNVLEASGSEKTEEEAPARENEEEEDSPNNKVEEEATTSGNNKEESPASDRAEQEAQPAPKVDGMDDESQSVVESMSSRQDEEAAESCFGNLGSCFRILRAILFFTTLAGIIPWWPHNRVHPANEPDEATLDDVVEAGGSEKTEEEALAEANEEEVGPGTEKVQEEAACIDEAEEEAGPSLENDEESPASDLVEQDDQLVPKVDGMDDESRCSAKAWLLFKC